MPTLLQPSPTVRAGQASTLALVLTTLVTTASVSAWSALGTSSQALIGDHVRSQTKLNDKAKLNDRAKLNDKVPRLVGASAAAIAPDLISVDPTAAWNKPCSLLSWCTVQRIANNSEPRSLGDRLRQAVREVFEPVFEHVGWRTRENLRTNASLTERVWDALVDLATVPVTVFGSASYDVVRQGIYDLSRLVRSPWNAVHRASLWKTPKNGSLYVDGLAASDVRQGLLNSCMVLSGLAALAEQNPVLIKDAITDNGDGTYTVRFYEQRPPGFIWEPEWTPHLVTVTAELPHGPDGRPVYARTPDDELWVAIMEKAWAEYNGGYGRIDGNYGQGILEALTRNTASAGNFIVDNLAADFGVPFELPQLEELEARLSADEIVLATTKGSSQHDLVTRHVYYVLGVDLNAKTVTVGNPWGTEHNRTIHYKAFTTDFATTVHVATR